MSSSPQQLGYAQSAQWSQPVDVSWPDTDGVELSGVLVRDPYQNLHMLWSKSYETGSSIYYSTDVGGTLSPSTDVLALPEPMALRLSAALTAPDLVLHLIWLDDYVRGNVYYSNAPLAEAGNPRVWRTPYEIVAQADMAILLTNESVVYLFYTISDAGGYENQVAYMRSEDDGHTWTDPVSIYKVIRPDPGFFMIAATFDELGRIHMGITYRTQTYGVNSEVGYMRSLDGGQTWEPYMVVATQNERTPNVSVIAPFAFGQNEVHLTWHDPRRMHMWSTDGGATWGAPVEIMQIGAGFGGANYLAKDSASVLHVVCTVGNNVYAARFLGSQWSASELVENRDMDPHFQQLLVTQGNRLHVIYQDGVSNNGGVWYTHKEVDAPHIEQSPIPFAQAWPAATATAPVDVNSVPVERPGATGGTTKIPLDQLPLPSSANTTRPLQFSLISGLVLLGAVYAVRTLLRRRE